MYERIMVCVDGSATSMQALAQAKLMVKGAPHGEIHVLHVLNERPSDTIDEQALTLEMLALRRAGTRILQRARSQLGHVVAKISTQLDEALGARLADIVCEHAIMWRADVIVIGTHGRRGVRTQYLGSDAEHVLNRSAIPVLLVRPRLVDESAAYDATPPSMRRLAA